MRTPLPEAKWTPMYIANPGRRWWQFRKPRMILNPDLQPMFGADEQWVDGMVWKEVAEL